MKAIKFVALIFAVWFGFILMSILLTISNTMLLTQL